MHNISLRPISDTDMDFLLKLYASTREEEMRQTGWPREQIGTFLKMQFDLQHTQYMENYDDASFDIILAKSASAGRLYVQRKPKEIRIIDIALMPEFQRLGIGSKLLNDLASEADRKQLILSLHVEHQNPIIAFYTKLGFKKKNDAGVYFLMERPPSASPPMKGVDGYE